MRAAFCAASRLTGYLPPTSRFASISVRLTSFATPARDDSRWWARQRPYEATFLEGVPGLSKMLIQRVPTKIPTKLPRGRRSVRRPYAQSPAALWSSIASDRTTKVARSLSVGKVFFEVGPARAARLSMPRRAVGQSCISAQISSDARDRPGSHPIRSGAEAVP